MTWYVEANGDGSLGAQGSTNVLLKDLEDLVPDKTFIGLEELLESPELYRWNGESLVALPLRPSPTHKFNYQTLEWEADDFQAWQDIRRDRDQKLNSSDWLRIKAQDTGEAVPIAWLDYRQALRNITEQSDPRNIVWPTEPAI